MTIDPFTQEVIHEALIAVVAEMRVTLLRTAFSSVIYEGQDFSCALADRRGRLACQSREDFPAHVGPLNMQVPQAIAKFGGKIHPGDVILANDPFTSGTHLNDVALISPIFWRNELVMFACSRAHWGDVGGMTPGSVSGQTKDIFQEGVRIPIIKIHDRGKPNASVYDLLFANVRKPRDRRGDLMSQLAAAKCGSERVLGLIGKFGHDTIVHCIDSILDRSEQRMRRQIARLPKGTYRFKDYLDSDGHSGEPIPICVKVDVKGRTVDVDFTGSAPQRPGPTNTSLAVTSTAVFVAMKALLDPQAHINEGAFRPFRISVPDGSLLNASYPAPMGGFVEVLRRVESALMGAMSRCISEQMAGDTKGCGNHVNISHIAGNAIHSIHYEYPAGGTGAFRGGDGSNAVREWDAGDFSSIHSAEIVEEEHPCLVDECTLASDSGGAGQWRGGLGLRRVVRILGPEASLSVLSDRNVIPPYGVNGGLPGHPNAFTVERDGRTVATSAIPGKVSGFPLQRGDRVISCSAGGGGYGNPADRAREAVERDVRAGYVTPETALALYSVDRGSGVAMRVNGVPRPLVGTGLVRPDVATRGIEQIAVSAATAKRLVLAPHALVELPGRKGAPLRGVLCIDDAVPDGAVAISSLAATILEHADGDPLEIRPLPAIVEMAP
jgi:N-methylhydantoinase B